MQKHVYRWDEYIRNPDDVDEDREDPKYNIGAMHFVRFGPRSGDPIWTIDLLESLRRISYTLALVPPIPVQGEVRQGDARLVLPKLRRKFDWVVTSPPYFGMYTYVSDQWLRSWFLGGRPAVDYNASQQISQGGIDGFTAGLATVWKWTAARCHAGAVMGVRFGALPSARVDPEQLVRESLDQADAGWKIREVRDAGMPKIQARQAVQFKRACEYAPEIDCIAILSEPRSRPVAR